MKKIREEIETKEAIKETAEETNVAIDNNVLSADELIVRINLLSEDKNPYSVSKEIEEIKSIFYIKLKKKQKEESVHDNSEKEGQQIKEELHPLEIKFKDVFNKYRRIKADFRKYKKEEEEKNLKIKKKIIEDIDLLVKEEESIKTTFEKFRSLQNKWKKTGHVPITESNHIWQSYHHHVELFYDFIKINNDLRDLDFKRNLEEKIIICEKAESLLNEKSINKAHNDLQELHEYWKNVGPVVREKRETLWERFQKISKKINKRRNDYFIERKKQNSIKLEEKNAISTLIDNLISEKRTSHNQWQEATKRCNELEKKWKSIGGLDKENNKTAWKKLRASLSDFYNTKNIFYKEQKKNKKQVLENKLALCKKAESMQHNTNWKETGKELINLQEEWKNSDFSPANESNHIWNRFRTACDTFFRARKAHYKKIKEQEEESYKKKETLLKKLEMMTVSSDSEEDIKHLKKFGSEWRNIGNISKDQTNIENQFLNLLNSKFEKLGLTEKVLASEKYKNRINSIKGNKKAINNEQQFIKGRIDTLKKEINQYENNISFFGNGEATKPLLEEAQRKIDHAKANIEDLEKKIQMLNQA